MNRLAGPMMVTHNTRRVPAHASMILVPFPGKAVITSRLATVPAKQGK